MYNSENVQSLQIDFLFNFTRAENRHPLYYQWEVSFFPVHPHWHYAISHLYLGPKDKQLKDTKETGQVENYRTVNYAYAERLLIEFLNERDL